jgi:hypothetical protein
MGQVVGHTVFLSGSAFHDRRSSLFWALVKFH